MTDIEAQHLEGVPWDWSQDLSVGFSTTVAQTERAAY